MRESELQATAFSRSDAGVLRGDADASNFFERAAQIDFSQIPALSKDILALLTDNPLFAPEGNFKTLLVKVSQAPAMLRYLDNQQNRKGHPNENFARELMELFTIGIGNYTETDVKEAARAFTGW